MLRIQTNHAGMRSRKLLRPEPLNIPPEVFVHGPANRKADRQNLLDSRTSPAGKTGSMQKLLSGTAIKHSGQGT